MKVLIDTCSLISFVRYYLPFGKEGKLLTFLEEQILSKNIIVLDKVITECSRQGKGLVINALPFLKNAKYKTDSTTLIPRPKFYNLIDNNFVIGSEKNRLDQAEYQIERDRFLNSTDLGLILYAYNHKDSETISIVTEETGYSNDGKVFKKIPEICKSIDINTMTLPEFFKSSEILDLSVNLTATTLF